MRNLQYIFVVIFICGLQLTCQIPIQEQNEEEKQGQETVVDTKKTVETRQDVAETDRLSYFTDLLNSIPIYNNTSIQHTSDIEDTLKLLKEGEKEIILKNEFKDVVLILGMTGAGKSTFAQWYAGNVSNLIAVDDGGGNYLIEDVNDKISKDSTIQSKTIFPELIVDKNNIAYYDMPGFSDTRSTANDISLSYFIKKVVDHANKVKIVICVNHSSLKKGIDRQDFIRLVKHITELIKVIDNYKDSILIVATKVDNTYRKLALVGDDTVIRGIVKFLEEVKQNLENFLNNSDESKKKKEYFKDGIKFIDALLKKDGENYGRLALFRRPDDEGPLIDSELLNEGREIIKSKLNAIPFVSKNSNDFGFTISDTSKVVVNDLIDQINREIIECITIVANDVKKYYKDIVKAIINNINTSTSRDAPKLDPSIANDFNMKINLGKTELSKLSNQLKNVDNLGDLTSKLKSNINLLNVQVSTKALANVTTQQKYLEFLIQASGKTTSSGLSNLGWSSLFQSIVTYLNDAKYSIKKSAAEKASSIEKNVMSMIEKSANSLLTSYSKKEDTINDIKNLHNYIKEEYEKISATKKRANSLSVGKCTQELSSYVSLTNDINSKIDNLEFLQILSDQNGTGFNCANALKTVISYLDAASRWYGFINRLYERLSSYNVQKDRTKCKSLSDMIGEKDERKKVYNTNMKKFLQDCYESNYAVEYDGIKDVIIDKPKLKKLQNIFQHTLKYEVEVKCHYDNDTIEFRAPFFLLSDISRYDHDCNYYRLEIFALDRIFIDESMDRTGKHMQIVIVAPTWDIRGEQKIILDGSIGRFHSLRRVEGVGMPGAPGHAGTGAGNFLGIGRKFLNSKSLTITAIGGNGGRGQDGSHGAPGSDGKDPEITPDTCCKTVDYCLDSGHVDCVGVWNGVRFKVKNIWMSFIKVSEIYIFQIDGEPGGKGGDGGARGNPGYGGEIIIKTFGDQTNFKVIAKDGEPGLLGFEGRGGLGGRTRYNRLIRTNKVFYYENKYSYYLDEGRRARRGEDGRVGANRKGSYWTGVTYFEEREIIMNNTIQYFMNNLINIKQSETRIFYNKLKKTDVKFKYEYKRED